MRINEAAVNRSIIYIRILNETLLFPLCSIQNKFVGMFVVIIMAYYIHIFVTVSQCIYYNIVKWVCKQDKPSPENRTKNVYENYFEPH